MSREKGQDAEEKEAAPEAPQEDAAFDRQLEEMMNGTGGKKAGKKKRGKKKFLLAAAVLGMDWREGMRIFSGTALTTPAPTPPRQRPCAPASSMYSWQETPGILGPFIRKRPSGMIKGRWRRRISPGPAVSCTELPGRQPWRRSWSWRGSDHKNRRGGTYEPGDHDTGNHVQRGKKLLAAGLCRIFKEDGLSVAPFKSQNMALNSYITEEGLEMGRAQVMQAEAAGIRPEAAMNGAFKAHLPYGSQVIVNGEVLGNYSAAEYFKMKKSLIPEIKRAYDSLAGSRLT